MKKLYYHGDILTMENTDYEAIYVVDGIIKKCGDFQDLKQIIPPETKLIDLQGKCLMPAFIDSHSHVVSLATTLKLVDLSKATSIATIIQSFKNYLNKNKPAANEVLIGFGYDHNNLDELRHPTAHELDQISTTNPLILAHASGHLGVINTKAMALFNLNDQVSDPVGGKYGRDKFNHLNGYLEEQAFFALSNQNIQNNIHLKEQIIEALKIYASYGITTVQEGFMKTKEFNFLNELAKEDKLFLDVVGYVDIKENQPIYQNHPEYYSYHNHFKLGGYKLFLDGSPQGKTAWMSQPYKNSGAYCGYPSYRDDEVKKFVELTKQQKIQLLTHCNGDAAANQLLDAFNDEHTNLRPVMIHSQTLRPDQLPRLKQIGIIPSFCINHVYYWGDVHLNNLGKRAKQISCVHSALKLELPYTFHQDSPVIAPNMLESIWCAAKRQTKKGIILGKDECISVYNALKGITINAAYQYFEEDQKGSIKEGKIADLVILSANPCKVAIDEIKQIQILETIKSGKTVFKKDIHS